MRTLALRFPRLRATARRRPGRAKRRTMTARPRRPVRFVLPAKRTFAPRTGLPREVTRKRMRVRRPARRRRGATRMRIRGLPVPPRAPLPEPVPAPPASGHLFTTSPPAVRATVWLGGGAAPRSIIASKAVNAVR